MRWKFTVRRLMIVIAILALPMWLIAMENQASKHARDVAKAMACLSRLRQVALATLQIVNSTGTFPPGAAPQPGAKPEDRWSWLVEMEVFYDERGGSGSVFDAAGNRMPTIRGVYRGMQCPVNPTHSLPNGDGLTHFVGIAGLGVDAPTLPIGDPRVGVFGYDRRIKMSDITDGTANTMMIAETSLANGAWFKGGPGTVRGLDRDPAHQPYIGRQFGGTHRGGGANVAYADGSVRFVKNTVDPKVFEATSTIAGGEPLPSGWDK